MSTAVRSPSLVPSWMLFLGLTIGPMIGVYQVVQAGFPDWAAVAVNSLVVFAALMAAQRLWPYSQAWRGWRSVAGVDLLHGLVSTFGAVKLLEAVTLGAVYAGSAWLSETVGATLWPTSLPLWAQFGLALIIGDFGYYWVHRAGHEVELFWRFHALHHSSRHMYVLASGRTHPVNAMAVYAAQVLPLVALGAPRETLLMLGVFTASHGLLQHANIRLRLGWLNWVFATADLHRWHHSVVPTESKTNFGSNIILWDVVFGTRFLPNDREIHEVGLPDMDYRRNFVRHLLSPFRYRTLVVPQPHADVDASLLP